jgi:alcohol dehydrogenase (cytochrome c)
MSMHVLGTRLAVAASVIVLAACNSSTSTTTSSASPGPSAAVVASASPEGSSPAFPDAQSLVNAGSDDADWLLPGKDYSNNRYSGLTAITPQNAGSLTKAWSTELADNGQQESAILVWHGTMYFATPHDNVLALDARTGKVEWQFPYNPAYSLVYTVSRGIGIEGDHVYLATLDCRVIAIDATTGKQVWNVNGCPNDRYTSTANSLFSMASYVYGDQIVLGTAGGDDGNIGHVMGFSTQDGHRLWDWRNIPGPGQPGHETWPADSWEHGGGDTWGGVTIDPATNTVFFSVGNPGPDMVLTRRRGLNLYTNSVLALDVSGSAPKLRWYYQLDHNDTHDTDPAMPPVLFNAGAGGSSRQLLAVADKGGTFVVLDRATGKLVFRLAVDDQRGLFTTVPTLQGTIACPNHGGGVEWNGGAYDPTTNLFLVPSTQECGTWKLVTTDPKYIPGQPYTGGPLPKRQNATGRLTAIDMSTGKVAWILRMPYSGQGGVVVTRGGVAFTSDAAGDVYAIDPHNGKVLWTGHTGASIVAPITVYGVDDTEYVSVLSGSAGAQQTPNMPVAKQSFVTVFRLGPVASPIANTTAGQRVVAGGPVTNANAPASVGSAPYTAAQVTAGAQVYQQRCAACHGAQLQGVSAPALTGPGFANSHLNLTNVRTIVTTQMPLGAPGSLTPQQYADVIAFLLKYDCVPASGLGTQPFPTTNEPGFDKVTLGGRSCPLKSQSGSGAF